MQLYQKLSRTVWLWDKWLLLSFTQMTLYFHICSCTCTGSILCSAPFSCWELRSDKNVWKCPEQPGDDPGGQQGFSKLCCVSPSLYPISIPFSNLKVKALRVKALKASMASYHKEKCLSSFAVLSGNRALNFILGKIRHLFFYSRLSRSSGTLVRDLSFPELRTTQTWSVGDCN